MTPNAPRYATMGPYMADCAACRVGDRTGHCCEAFAPVITTEAIAKARDVLAETRSRIMDIRDAEFRTWQDARIRERYEQGRGNHS